VNVSTEKKDVKIMDAVQRSFSKILTIMMRCALISS